MNTSNFNFVKLPMLRSVSGSRVARTMSENVENVVRTSFLTHVDEKTREVKGVVLVVYLGKKLAESVGIKSRDRVDFFVEDNNPRVWYLEKSRNNDGLMASDIKQANGTFTKSLRITKAWRAFVPTDKERGLQVVTHKKFRNGLLILLND